MECAKWTKFDLLTYTILSDYQEHNKIQLKYLKEYHQLPEY